MAEVATSMPHLGHGWEGATQGANGDMGGDPRT